MNGLPVWARQPRDPFITSSFFQARKYKAELQEKEWWKFEAHQGDFLIEYICYDCRIVFREKDHLKQANTGKPIQCFYCKKIRSRIKTFWKPILWMVPLNRFDKAVFLMEHMG